MDDLEWTADMGEISGFGGDYEDACQRMALAGVAHLRVHPQSYRYVNEWPGIGLVFGTHDEGDALLAAMVAACPMGRPTILMMHACVHIVAYVGMYGWEEFQRVRRAQ